MMEKLNLAEIAKGIVGPLLLKWIHFNLSMDK